MGPFFALFPFLHSFRYPSRPFMCTSSSLPLLTPYLSLSFFAHFPPFLPSLLSTFLLVSFPSSLSICLFLLFSLPFLPSFLPYSLPFPSSLSLFFRFVPSPPPFLCPCISPSCPPSLSLLPSPPSLLSFMPFVISSPPSLFSFMPFVLSSPIYPEHARSKYHTPLANTIFDKKTKIDLTKTFIFSCYNKQNISFHCFSLFRAKYRTLLSNSLIERCCTPHPLAPPCF